MEFNLCTSSQGEFSLCAKDKPTPRPVAPPAPSNPSRGQRPKTFNDGYGSGGANSGGGGLAGWAVSLIVIIVLILAFCIAYYVWKSMRYNRDDKGMSNNIYLDQNKDRGFDGRSYAGQTAARSTRTKRTRQSRRSYDQDAGAEIVMDNKNDNTTFDDFTINTYGTKQPEEAEEESVLRITIGRDPTMYIPGQEDKPDPDSSDVLMITDGAASTRQYFEDPPVKAKRDPTMYVDGDGDYSASGYKEASNRKPRRDPTMYDGVPRREPTMYVNDEVTEPDNFMTDRSNRSSDPYGMNDIDEASEYYGGYDDVSQNHHANSSGHDRRDPSFYLSVDNLSDNMSQGEESFRTQEPSVASSRPSRSKKKKKKTRQYQ